MRGTEAAWISLTSDVLWIVCKIEIGPLTTAWQILPNATALVWGPQNRSNTGKNPQLCRRVGGFYLALATGPEPIFAESKSGEFPSSKIKEPSEFSLSVHPLTALVIFRVQNADDRCESATNEFFPIESYPAATARYRSGSPMRHHTSTSASASSSISASP
jgi:hypothetical protein